MLRRFSLTPLVLLLAMMGSPVAGTARPAESLRLVVGIVWLSADPDDQTESVRRPTPGRAVPANVPTHPAYKGCEPDSRALGAPLHRSRFQRPPPVASL